jgi:hypothetical protein
VLSMDTRVKPAYDGPEKNVSDLATFRLTSVPVSVTYSESRSSRAMIPHLTDVR